MRPAKPRSLQTVGDTRTKLVLQSLLRCFTTLLYYKALLCSTALALHLRCITVGQQSFARAKEVHQQSFVVPHLLRCTYFAPLVQPHQRSFVRTSFARAKLLQSLQTKGLYQLCTPYGLQVRYYKAPLCSKASQRWCTCYVAPTLHLWCNRISEALSAPPYKAELCTASASLCTCKEGAT